MSKLTLQNIVPVIALLFTNVTGAIAHAAEPPQGNIPSQRGPDCSELLVVTGDSRLQRFSLTTCDVTLDGFNAAAPTDMTFRLKPSIAAWWREFFRTTDLAAGSPIYVSPSDMESFPYGVLADHDMTGPLRETWLWNRDEGTLQLKNVKPHYHAHQYRVCNSAIRNATLYLAIASTIRAGAVFTAALKKTAPRGAANEISKSCASDWVLSPGAPATMHPEWGIGMVDRQAQDGDKFTIKVRVGNQVLTSEVRVYLREAHPLMGLWRQVGERSCDNGELRKPAVPISEFRLRPDGTFDLTWLVRNHDYVDYRGTYLHRRDSAAFEWQITGGQTRPTNASGSGFARIDDNGRLLVSGMAPAGNEKVCDMLFERVNTGH